MRRGAAVAVLVGAIGLAACGSQEPSDERQVAESKAPSEASDGSSDSEPSDKSDASDAQQALKDAVAVMQSEPVTGFRADTLIGQTPMTVTEGAMVETGWRSSTRFDDATTSKRWDYRVKTISTNGLIWMQMDWTDARAGCWLTLAKGEVPLGILAMRPHEPAYITLLGHLNATGFTDESRNALHGELGLNAAISLMSASLVEQVDTEASALEGAKVPVMMGYDGDRISGIGMNGADLLAALEGAGATVGTEARTALERVVVTVNYPTTDKPAAVSAPPRNLQFTAGTPGCQ